MWFNLISLPSLFGGGAGSKTQLSNNMRGLSGDRPPSLCGGPPWVTSLAKLRFDLSCWWITKILPSLRKFPVFWNLHVWNLGQRPVLHSVTISFNICFQLSILSSFLNLPSFLSLILFSVFLWLSCHLNFKLKMLLTLCLMKEKLVRGHYTKHQQLRWSVREGYIQEPPGN